jgi:hypothetical protein
MVKKKRLMVVLVIFVAFMATALFLPNNLRCGSLEPTAPPGSTMKTLEEIPPTWSQKLPVSERFELVMGDEAVLDKETGVVWAKNANLASGTKTWQQAINYCYFLFLSDRTGWRLPTVEELTSLLDLYEVSPALPDGHPFDNVQNGWYWSSTTYESDSIHAWGVGMEFGAIGTDVKALGSGYVWPVRGGN